RLTFKKSLVEYINALCLSGNALWRAAAGRTMVSKMTFRATSWSNVLWDRRAADRYTAEELWLSFCRQAMKLRAYAERLRASKAKTKATYADALECLDLVEEPSRTVLYADPACPFHPNHMAPANP